MNKLITSGFTGGFPYELDDIRWNDEAYRDVFTSILKGFSTGSTDNLNFIIQGCVPNPLIPSYGESFTLSSGYIMLNGEILKVDAQNGQNAFVDHYKKITTYAPGGIKISKDGNYTGSTYQMNRAILSGNTGDLIFNGPRFSDIIKNVIDLSSINSQISALTTKVNDLLSFSGSTEYAIWNLNDHVNYLDQRALEVKYIGEVTCSSILNGIFNSAPGIKNVFNPNNITPTITRTAEGIFDINVKEPNEEFEVSCTTLDNQNKYVTPKQFIYKIMNGTYGFTVYCSDDIDGYNDCLFRFTIYRRPYIA